MLLQLRRCNQLCCRVWLIYLRAYPWVQVKLTWHLALPMISSSEAVAPFSAAAQPWIPCQRWTLRLPSLRSSHLSFLETCRVLWWNCLRRFNLLPQQSLSLLLIFLRQANQICRNLSWTRSTQPSVYLQTTACLFLHANSSILQLSSLQKLKRRMKKWLLLTARHQARHPVRQFV